MSVQVYSQDSRKSIWNSCLIESNFLILICIYASFYVQWSKYVLILKTFRTEPGKEPRYAFIPVETYEVKDLKNCFKKFLRACVPSVTQDTSESSTTTTNQGTHLNQNGFNKLIQDSKWFDHVSFERRVDLNSCCQLLSWGLSSS